MILFPAVDILNGQSVRLLYGDFNRVTVYGDPVEMAKKWEAQGARFLHLVDLNGAKSGEGINLDIIKKIVSSVNIPVQLGGGVRTLEDIDERINKTGVNRVILGSSCYLNPEIIDKAIEKYSPERIVCGIDAKDNKLAIKGWVEQVDCTPVEFGKKMKNKGLKYVVYTDISRDGALSGVNSNACALMAKETGLNVIASGGVSSLSDIKTLKKLNMYGVILGKAIYSGVFDVSDAVRILNN